MAQLVARLNGIQKARGSNPLVSTTKNIVHLYDIFFYAKTRVSYERSRSFTYKISLMIDDRLFMHHPEKMMFS